MILAFEDSTQHTMIIDSANRIKKDSMSLIDEGTNYTILKTIDWKEETFKLTKLTTLH
jgi:Ca2+-dependent lipid-binding protein